MYRGTFSPVVSFVIASHDQACLSNCLIAILCSESFVAEPNQVYGLESSPQNFSEHFAFFHSLLLLKLHFLVDSHMCQTNFIMGIGASYPGKLSC